MSTVPNAYFSAIASKERIDPENGVIYGVSVITKGEAKGHDVFIDDKSLEQFASNGQASDEGVKVKMKHFKQGEDSPIFSVIGSLKNFRVDGDSVRADLHLLKTDENYAKILEMADKMPSQFGLSVSCSMEIETIEEKQFIRVKELSSVDLVDAPAANPTGLFSEKEKAKENKNINQINMNIDQIKLAKALGLAETATEAEISDALIAKLSAKPADVTGLEAKISDAQIQLATIEAKTKEAAIAAKKVEVDNLIAEASRDGKVIPLTNEQLHALPVDTVKEMISKLPKAQVQLERKPTKPSDKDGKALNGEALVQFCREKATEGAAALTQMFHRINGINN